MKFELEGFHRNIPDEKLIKDVLRVATKIGKETITKREYKDHGGQYGENTFLRRFGPWNSILKRAGLKQSINRNISEEELLKNMIFPRESGHNEEMVLV